MRTYTVTYPAYPNDIVTRTELSPEIFEKITEKIKSFLQSHNKAWDVHRSDNESSPVIGRGVRLHDIEDENVYQFNMSYFFRPQNMYFYHNMKQVADVTFSYKKQQTSDLESPEIDKFTLYQGNVITYQHQYTKPKPYNGINRYMWEKPDLDDSAAQELLKRIEIIFDEEKKRGNLL